jgi:hypothetical protein
MKIIQSVSAALPLKVVRVWVDGMPQDASVIAYASTVRWNGFAQPSLPYESGMQLIKWIPELKYDESNDAFIYDDPEDEGGEMVFKAETVQVNGKEVKAYPIGAGYWTWQLA